MFDQQRKRNKQNFVRYLIDKYINSLGEFYVDVTADFTTPSCAQAPNILSQVLTHKT